MSLWCRVVVVLATAQFHPTKPELTFSVVSNPLCCVSEIYDGENLWIWSRLEIRLNSLAMNHSAKTIHQHHSSHNRNFEMKISVFFLLLYLFLVAFFVVTMLLFFTSFVFDLVYFPLETCTSNNIKS